MACIEVAIKAFAIADDLLVLGGDTLFFEDFDLGAVLGEFAQTHRGAGSAEPTASLVLSYPVDDAGTLKHGILELDEQRRVTAFLEKPGPEATAARNACPCFYILSPAAQQQIPAFLEAHKDGPLADRDAPGNFLRFLHTKVGIAGGREEGRGEGSLRICRLNGDGRGVCAAGARVCAGDFRAL